ncbi:MAG: Ig-like domain-containing protein [Terracidiphilus sp.]
MRGILCRGLRLELVRGLGIALAMSALTVAAGHAQSVNTTTTLTEQAGPSATCPTQGLTVALTDVTVTVTGDAGVPDGTVVIMDGAGSSAVQLASAALDSTGQAGFGFYLSDGDHSLSAVYAGNTTFITSTSAASSVNIASQCDSAFVVTTSTLAPATLTPGESGTSTVTVTPSVEFVSALKTPGFITLSCSGLPDQASCAFTPANLEILPGQDGGVTSSMVVLTYAASTTSISPATRPGTRSSPIAWAFLLPGILSFGGLAWGSRRRRWLKQLLLVALVGLVTLLGTTACNPRYKYENHGPLPNPATPAGTYTVKVTGQFSNGVTADTNSTSLVVTVK